MALGSFYLFRQLFRLFSACFPALATRATACSARRLAMTARHFLYNSMSRPALLLYMLFALFGPSLIPVSAQPALRPSDPTGGFAAASAEMLTTVTTSSDVVDGNVSSLATLASQPG